MSKRLESFDYTSPFFYMVTIKKMKGASPFSSIVAPGRCELNEITKAFVKVVRSFHLLLPVIEEIGRFSIMPDHIHLIIKLLPLVAIPLTVAEDLARLRALAELGYAPLASPSTGLPPLSTGFVATGLPATGSAALPFSAPATCLAATGLPATGSVALPFSPPATGLAATGNCPLSLTEIVSRLIIELERAYWRVLARAGDAEAQVMITRLDAGVVAGLAPVFNAGWHEYIVKKKGQLESFTRYIRENPARYWRRRENAKYFNRVRPVEFLGKTWYAYGNAELLELPVLEPLQCSRRLRPGDAAWTAAVAAAGRIGPGGAGVSTFMSECEKACGHELGLNGGKFIVLAPENFPPAEGESVSPSGWRTRWHPYRNHEAACARGDLVYLSLYEPMGRQATRAELYQRCHEMGDYVTAALGGRKWQ